MSINPIEQGNNCAYPVCPECGKGNLVPFSYKEDVYEKWKCTSCKYEIKKRDEAM